MSRRNQSTEAAATSGANTGDGEPILVDPQLPDNGTPKKKPRKLKAAIKAMHTIGLILDELEPLDRQKVMTYLWNEYMEGERIGPPEEERLDAYGR